MELLVTFCPLMGESFSIPFSTEGGEDSPFSLLHYGGSGAKVQGDMSYRLKLDTVGRDFSLGQVMEISVLVNGLGKTSVYSGGELSFPPVFGQPSCIFQDSFGFAEVALVVRSWEGQGSSRVGQGREDVFVSPPLPVLILEGSISRSVENMAEFVYEKQSLFLEHQRFFTGEASLEGPSVGGEFSSRMSLAEDILEVYEMQLPYFQSNCRFRMESVAVVERMEKLQQVTPATVSFMVQHPEYLKKVSGERGISWSGERYLPSKTLVSQQVYSKDIYENRMVLGFLHSLQEGLDEMMEELSARMASSPEMGEGQYGRYMASYQCILGKVSRLLTAQRQRLVLIQERCLSMMLGYHRVLDMPLERWERLSGTPSPTAVLLSVPQYHGIYVRMDQWFGQKVPEFRQEEAFLSCVQISVLYEQYLLTKFLEYFRQEGWEKVSFHYHHYGLDVRDVAGAMQREDVPEFSRFSKGKEGDVPNTFEFVKGTQRVRLFYQPNIYDSDHMAWNAAVGLYRNNDNTLQMDQSGVGRGYYYQPDFVFRIWDGSGASRFVIADGKFSSLYGVKQYYLMPLIYKYLFSLTPTQSGDEISGLAVFYGKCGSEELQESAYNKQIGQVRPFTELFPFVEGVQSPDLYLKKMLEL